MRIKIFIAFRYLTESAHELKKITYQGKEYQGVFAEKECLSLKEIGLIASSLGQDPSHVQLIPIALFGSSS